MIVHVLINDSFNDLFSGGCGPNEIAHKPHPLHEDRRFRVRNRLNSDTMPDLRTETHAGTHCEISHVNHLFTTIQSVYSTRL